MTNFKPAKIGFLAGGLAIVCVAAFSLYNVGTAKPSHIVRVTGKNPALLAAIKEAKDGLDAFIKELSTPKPGEGFAVKGTFTTPEGPEYLWVRSPVFKDGVFTGKLDQQPIAVPGKNKGDTVSVPKKEAVDWLIKDDQGTRGAFTEKALSAQSSP